MFACAGDFLLAALLWMIVAGRVYCFAVLAQKLRRPAGDYKWGWEHADGIVSMYTQSDLTVCGPGGPGRGVVLIDATAPRRPVFPFYRMKLRKD